MGDQSQRQWERVAHKEDFSRSSHGQGQSGTTAPLSPPQRTCQQKLTLVFVPPLTSQRLTRDSSDGSLLSVLPDTSSSRMPLDSEIGSGTLLQWRRRSKLCCLSHCTACSQNLGCASLSFLTRG